MPRRLVRFSLWRSRSPRLRSERLGRCAGDHASNGDHTGKRRCAGARGRGEWRCAVGTRRGAAPDHGGARVARVERAHAGAGPRSAGGAGKGRVFTAAGLLRLASRIAVEQRDATTARLAAELAANRMSELAMPPSAASSGRRRRPSVRHAALLVADLGGRVRRRERDREFKLNFQGGYVPNKIDVSAAPQRGSRRIPESRAATW